MASTKATPIRIQADSSVLDQKLPDTESMVSSMNTAEMGIVTGLSPFCNAFRRPKDGWPEIRRGVITRGLHGDSNDYSATSA